MHDLEDAELMVRVGAGQAELLGELFARNGGALFGFFLRITGHRATSEDLVQDVFLRALKYAKSFKRGSRFKPWLYQIARNVHVDHVNRRFPEVALDSVSEPLASEGNCPHAGLVTAEDGVLLQQALAQLPESKRELLLLSRDPDFSYKDLAEMFGCSEGALKVQVHRALKDLRMVFQELLGGGR